MAKKEILGIPETVGQLRKLLEKYPDDMDFGFLQQPRQELQYLEFEKLEEELIGGMEEKDKHYRCIVFNEL